MDINAFTILPMSQRFSLAAGKTEKGSIKIVNPADATEDFSYKIGISPYGVVGEDYEADLVTDSNHTMIAKWIKISEPTGTVKPNETKEVEFTIEVPADAPAGGQYAAITVSSNNEAKQSSGVAVQNVFEMASIVYGTVAGETRHISEVGLDERRMRHAGAQVPHVAGVAPEVCHLGKEDLDQHVLLGHG